MNNIILFAANENEVMGIFDAFSLIGASNRETKKIGGMACFDLGIIGGTHIFLFQCEIGSSTPGGALLTVYKAITELKPIAVIMIGVAFGADKKKQKIGEILISKQIQAYEYHKIQNGTVHLRGDKVTCGQTLLNHFRNAQYDWKGTKPSFGLILSGEKLVDDINFNRQLFDLAPEAIGGEMEGGGLYSAASSAQTEWIIIKSICDWGDGTKTDKAQREASRNAADYVVHVIQKGYWIINESAKNITGLENAPITEELYGRDTELTTLKNWINKEKCSVIGIVGMRGVGKSMLTSHFCRSQISNANSCDANHFDHIIWKGLVNAPPLIDIISDIIQIVSGQPRIELPTDTDALLCILLEYLQHKKCLIVLDNFESILDPKLIDIDSYIQQYSKLIKKLGSSKHSSCLLLTSSVVPKALAALEGNNRPTRKLELFGIDNINGIRIFDSIGDFTGAKEEYNKVISLYNGNPLALNLVAKHIKEVYLGRLKSFLEKGKSLFNDLQDLLNWHHDRLTSRERELLYWIALNREPISLESLENDLLSYESREDLPSTIQSLRNHFPLDKHNSKLFLQPIFIEFATKKIIKKAEEDIINFTCTTLDRYALLKALAKDYIRKTQLRIIISPLNENLIRSLNGESGYKAHFKKYILELRKNIELKPSYAAGNILNLLSNFNRIIDGYDFSELSIRQAFLQDSLLHNVRFTNSKFKHCVFLQTFGPISSLTISSDGKLMAASESSGSIHIYSTNDLQIKATLTGHTNWVFALEFSPDGKMLASGGEDKSVRLWSTEDFTCHSISHHTNSVWTVAFNPKGQILATGSDDNSVKIWNSKNGQCIKTLTNHTDKVFSVAFSDDGHKLASCSADRTIKIYDIFDWDSPHTIDAHSNVVRDISFKSNDQILASCSWDKTIKFWNHSNLFCTNEITDVKECIHSIAFDSNSNNFAVSDESGNIHIYDAETLELIKKLQDHTGEVWKITFAKNTNLLISGGYDRTIRFWDTKDWKCLHALRGYINWVQATAVSPTQDIIVGSNADLSLEVWDAISRQRIKRLRQHTGWTFGITFNFDGSMMASGSDDKTIKIWDTKSWEVIKVLRGHERWVQTVDFDHENKTLASAGDDKTIKIWDLIKGECAYSLCGHTDGIWSVKFFNKKPHIASGSEDHTIKIWDLTQKTCIKTLTGHTDRISSIAIHHSDRYIASSSEDKSVIIWDLETDAHTIMNGHTGYVTSVTFDNTGNFIISCSKDNSIRVWDLKTQECCHIFNNHQSGVWSVSCDPKTNFIISGSEDGTIKAFSLSPYRLEKNYSSNRPYQDTDITGVSGLSPAQLRTLERLGATSKTEKKITHDYNQFAKEYSTLDIDGTYYLAFRDIPSILRMNTNGRRGLDYGCGTGRSTRFLKEIGYNMSGVDISPTMITEAVARDKHGEYIQIKSAETPFPNASFDFVFSSFVFIEVDNLAEIERILIEMKRILKPGGIFVFVTSPASTYDGNWVSFDYDLSHNENELTSGDSAQLSIKGTNVVLYDYFWSQEDYTLALKNAKLSIIDIHHPIGKTSDPVNWLDEAHKAYFSIYVTKKD
ncbi:methyltransferase domain-containing protein [Maridesulfovibrio sp. FT414]|uniref:WD40 domain-containing protein n=1 Tax=Maridesulfovibrio sp. FT414 TaxID=2979469 RepID=UPI003D8075DA